MWSVPAQPELALGDGDFRAGGWSDQPAPDRAPAPRPGRVAAEAAVAPAEGAIAAVTATSSLHRRTSRNLAAGTEVPGNSRRGRVLVLAVVVLELLAAAGAFAVAVAVWEARARVHALSGIPVVGELPSALFWLSVSLSVMGVMLTLLVWPSCRGGLWARRSIMVLLMTGALPGLLAGILPGAAMVLAVVLLARPDVRARFASRGRRRDDEDMTAVGEQSAN